MKSFQIDVGKKLDGMRLDLAIVAADIGLSRRRIRAIIDIGGAYLNRRRVRVASRIVRCGDQIKREYNPTALQKLKAPQEKGVY